MGVFVKGIRRPGGREVEVETGGLKPTRNIGQVELDFNNLTVNNTTAQIPFVFGDGDPDMIDLTDPAMPIPVAAGIYAYTLKVNQIGAGDGLPFHVELVIDDDYYSITLKDNGGATEDAAIETVWFCTAGSPFLARVVSTGNDLFGGNLYVQKFE
jgi:hypothetical protein